jgi:hypothetical protein
MDTISEVPFHRIERYVKYPPVEGFLIMVNDAFNLRLRPEFAKATVIESDGVNAVALIETFDSISEAVPRVHTGSLTVRYKRLDMSEWFTATKLKVKAPTNTSVILNLLRTNDSYYLTANDIVADNSLEQVSTIEAAEQSLFWWGSFLVELS